MSKIHDQIVYFGLSRLSDDRSVVRSAYQHWKKQLSGEAFDIIEVATKLVEFLGLDSSGRKTLMIAMHSGNNKTSSELPNVPPFISGEDAQDDVEQSSPQTESNLPAHCYMTTEFFSSMYRRLRRVDAAAYAELSTIIADEGLDGTPQSLHNAITVSVTNGLVLNKDVTEKQCQELTNAVTLLMSEVVGPMLTDDIIDTVITSLLDNSKAGQFDPRKLL